MKYDPELLLQLAELIEAKPDKDVLLIDQIQLPELSRDELVEHLRLLLEAHLILATIQYADGKVVQVRITGLTRKGLQFLMYARDIVWQEKFLREARIDAGSITREGFLVALASHFPNYL